MTQALLVLVALPMLVVVLALVVARATRPGKERRP
jgi:hypothetical protein